MAEKFDAYARDYEALHRSSIGPSGEDPAYFHEYKVDCLVRRKLVDGPLLDYGCGIGNLTERFVRRWSEVHAYDPSLESVKVARQRAPDARFYSDVATLPRNHFAAAVLSGVLHHVPPSGRADVLDSVRRTLRPGGRLVLFEHNPLNPLTRRAVAACPFDDDAILLWPWEARRLVSRSGFAGVTLDFIVFFPRLLAFLRPLEPRLHALPIGAQQMLVATRA